jgi:hypothetical protein
MGVWESMGEDTHGSVTHGSVTHGSVTHGSVTHGSVTHGSVTHGSVTHVWPKPGHVCERRLSERRVRETCRSRRDRAFVCVCDLLIIEWLVALVALSLE